MDATAFAKAVADQVERIVSTRLEPLIKRLEELESVDQVKAADVSAEVVKSILDGDNLEHIVGLKVAEHLAENPPPAGEKGADGRDGADGKDGVGMAGALIDRDGSLVVTMTNGEVKSLGAVVGKDGASGKDGFSLEDFSAESDGNVVTLKFTGQGITKAYEISIPAPVYKGYYRSGRKCLEGDMLTHDGSLWVAKRANCSEPCLNSDDWQLAVRKGRDGRDGKNGRDLCPAPAIKLGGSDAGISE